MLNRSFDHRKKQDLLELRDVLERAPDDVKIGFIVLTRVHGIMLGPALLSGGLWVAQKRHGKIQGTAILIGTMFQRQRAAFDDIWKSTLDHMVNGKDAYDPRSAGGWNKQELDIVLKFLDGVKWNPYSSLDKDNLDEDVVGNELSGIKI